MAQKYMKELVLGIVTFFWLLFVATNVNMTLGQIYLHFTLGSLALLIIGITIFDKKIEFTFQNKEGGTLKAMFAGIAGWITLLITSVIVLKFVDPANANIASVIGLLGATTPALATSKIANLITFGVAIAYIETTLWARLLEFFSDLLRINKRKLGVGLFVLIFLLGLAFMLFHLTAKGITNTPALLIVFIMMLISLGMVIIFQETRQAVYLHIFANTTAAYLMLFATGMLQLGA